ncbi:MAG: sugar ABC transporter permease [Lachnospiraceae bacterium]|nr:sugar ABC transporter permease [Lachnospiraceae bacterium]MBQ6545081.1 sugar ABC transporter permease [Lachnospiraceae bacterium]
MNKRQKSERRFDTLMLGIPVIYYGIFMLIPCLAGLYFSLTDFGGYSLKFSFVGLYNYRKIFADPAFWKSVVNYFKLYFATVIICFPLAYITAIVLTKNKKLKERSIYRILFFFPSTVPTLIIAIMWMTMYNPSFGVLNQWLGKVGIGAIQWLGSSKWAIISVIIVVIWRQFGFYLVYFMAGVSNVPQSIYESALIDGASEWKQAIKITVPLTWDVIKTSMLFYVMSAVNLGFGTVYVLTQGGPDNASQVISSYMYYQIAKFTDYGLASAIGVFMMLMTLIMALAILKLMKRETYEF